MNYGRKSDMPQRAIHPWLKFYVFRPLVTGCDVILRLSNIVGSILCRESINFMHLCRNELLVPEQLHLFRLQFFELYAVNECSSDCSLLRETLQGLLGFVVSTGVRV